MREILLFCVVVSSVYCVDETLSDLLELLKDPTILSKIEKRLGAGVEDDLFSDVIGCFDTSGTVNSNCDFYANSSAIIKTSESIARGAEFLKEYTNVTCPRECTARCCDLPNCDTSVYQDKGDHKCYLFHCGGKSSCVFTHHSDYWTGSISKETHKSHSFTPGVATHSHENELENLGSHDDDELEAHTTRPTPPPTTVRPTTTTTTRATTITTSLPGLGDYCPSYGSKCEDPHAECLMKSCRCRVGYHEKHGVCRKHCRNEEFECENYAYYSDIDSRECIPSEYVCDGNPDCIDASDESNCQDKNKDEKVPPRKPMVNTDDNRNNRLGPGQYPDRVAPGRVGPGRLEPPVNPTSTTVKQFVSTAVPTTAAPVPTQPPQTVKPTPVNIDKSDSQASVDIDQDSKPVSQDLDSSSDNQSTDNTESKNSNTESKNSNTESKNSNTESKNSTDDEKTEGSGTNKFNILNAESVEVTSYTDSFQGPIVALALGLAITMMLLIFVGCRLRTVKRRLRKGRALHSNEADYLINGMYL